MKNYYPAFVLMILIIQDTNGQNSTGFQSPSATVYPYEFYNPDSAFASDDKFAGVFKTAGCYCPYIFMSWDYGGNFCHEELLGPFSPTERIDYEGGSKFTWGHVWYAKDFLNDNFLLKISNPTREASQGYKDFNFTIPPNSLIDGIEVRVEARSTTIILVDMIQVNVFYHSNPDGLDYSFLKNDYSIAPNPFALESVLKSNTDFRNALVLLHNIAGREVQLTYTISGNEIRIYRESLPAGIYYISVLQENIIFLRRKVVVE